MKRESFVWYESFYKAIKCLPPTNGYNAAMFIIEYGLEGKDPDESVDPLAYAIFLMAKPQLDANNKRFINGQKGGRPRINWNNLQKPNLNQTQTEVKPNVNVNENVNANENVNVNEKQIIIKQKKDEEVMKNKKIEYSELFESFRSIYPKKKSKQQAREAWLNAIKGGNDPKFIIKKAGDYATEIKLKRIEDKFIKYAQGWLNDGRYDDDYFTGNDHTKPDLEVLY